MEPNYTWIYSDVDEWKYILGSNYSSRKYYSISITSEILTHLHFGTWNFFMPHSKKSCHICPFCKFLFSNLLLFYRRWTQPFGYELTCCFVSRNPFFSNELKSFTTEPTRLLWLKECVRVENMGIPLSNKAMDPRLLDYLFFFFCCSKLFSEARTKVSTDNLSLEPTYK
jgi:hypothetical protein